MSAAALVLHGTTVFSADGPWADQVRLVVEQSTRDMTTIHGTRMLSETEKREALADSLACSQAVVVLEVYPAVAAANVLAVALAHRA